MQAEQNERDYVHATKLNSSENLSSNCCQQIAETGIARYQSNIFE